MQADFNLHFDDVVHEPIIYGDFVAHTADKAYQELDDLTLVNIRMFVLFSGERIFVFIFR